MSLYCVLDDLKNESDVEQKFLYQFLTRMIPEGCGYDSTDILTKSNIRSYTIGKANHTFQIILSQYMEYLLLLLKLKILLQIYQRLIMKHAYMLTN